MIPNTSRLRYGNDFVNVVFDGNSLVAGVGASGAGTYLPAQLAGVYPLIGKGMTVANLGNGGWTWGMMDGTRTPTVESAWVNGKTNVLIAWETTNDVFNLNATAANTIVHAKSYIANRLAAHPWKIILLTTIPRQVTGNQPLTDSNNAVLDAVDAAFRRDYRSYGAYAVCDLRFQGSPFAFPDYSLASFSAANVDALWADPNGSRIHLNDAGYGVIAKIVGRTLSRIPFR